MDLVETLFARHGIQNLRYDGKMDKGSREIALATFKKPGGPKVLLLRCAWLVTPGGASMLKWYLVQSVVPLG